MVVELPSEFLSWNYFSRRESIKSLIEGKHEQNMNLFFLESTRHTPALCTAFTKSNGAIYVNAKIVGIGYVLKEEFLSKAIEVLSRHIKWGDELLVNAQTSEERREATKEYQRKGMLLLLKHLYFEPEEAWRRVDFTKMSTVELAASKPHSSKHTWRIVQKNKTACLLFYRPPNLSFELHGWLDVYRRGLYYEFVNAVHDAFHYVPLERRQVERPVYIFNVEEVYDNSPTARGYGVRKV